MSKILWWTSAVLLFLAVGLGIESYQLHEAKYEFPSDLLLHIVAEFIAIALGIAVPLIIASLIIRRRLDILARPIVEFIARLRIEKD